MVTPCGKKEQFMNVQLQQAQQALAAGNKRKAQALIADVLKAEPANGEAWYLLGEATDDNRKEVYLKRAVQLLPNHAQANQRLKELTAPPAVTRPEIKTPPTPEPVFEKPFTPPPTTPEPMVNRPVAIPPTPTPPPAKVEPKTPAAKEAKPGRQIDWYLVGMVFCLILALILAFLIFQQL